VAKRPQLSGESRGCVTELDLGDGIAIENARGGDRVLQGLVLIVQQPEGRLGDIADDGRAAGRSGAVDGATT